MTLSAWGIVWDSDAISLRERSMLTLAIRAATGIEPLFPSAGLSITMALIMLADRRIILIAHPDKAAYR